MKMRIKAGNTVELIKRCVRAFRKGLEFRLWQIPETQLYGSQFVKDHVIGLAKLRRCAQLAGAFLGTVTTHTRGDDASCK